MGLRAEERRLRRAIGALLVTMSPMAAVQACGTDDASATRDGGTNDATIDRAQPLSVDATSDTADALDLPDTAASGFDANCTSTITVIDAGLDGDAYADPGCLYGLSCGINGTLSVSGCQVLNASDPSAPPLPLGCWIVADSCAADVWAPDAPVGVQCADCVSGGGRRPRGLRASPGVSVGVADEAHYFAALAFEEDAAILAFDRMVHELTEHGAPMSLRRAALRATRDERRHARLMRARAVRLGASPAKARLEGCARRELVEIALENAAEGCVRETYGAALLAYQAKHATDGELAAMLGAVARDEANHAALSWSLAQWAEPKLDPRSRARVRRARTEALAKLRVDIAQRAPRDYDARVGHPSSHEALALLDGIAAALHLA